MHKTHSRTAGRSRLIFDLRLLFLILASGLPAVLALVLLFIYGDYAASLGISLLLLIVLLWLGFAFHARREVIYHLQTLSNLLEALREGDYSLRGRRARWGDALGEVVWEINTLGQTLREQRLEAREASALLQKVIAEIDIAVFAFDGSRALQLANPAGERLLAQPLAQLSGRSATELELADLLAGDARSTLQRSFPGGSGRWEIRHGTFREAGLPHYLLVITDLSRTLREEERKAWQRLIRVLGHELNNSLAPIKSMASTLQNLLRREALPDDWRDDVRSGLGVMADRADALGRFMAAYAMLARLPAPRKLDVSLLPLINRVTALDARLPVRISGKDIKVNVDPDQLEQLLINLVKNAVDAAAPVGGEVNVNWFHNGGEVVLEVLDTGPGIANSDNLFVPFFTTKPGGTGIGLALSRQIAEAHGGVLTLENRAGTRGCAARVVLPS